MVTEHCFKPNAVKGKVGTRQKATKRTLPRPVMEGGGTSGRISSSADANAMVELSSA